MLPSLLIAPTAMSEYQNTCTPGYYNGEGTNEGQGFLQTNYPDGGLAFFDLLAGWREQGDFEGLILG
jgi:cyclohexanone monooxygenase